MQQAGLSVANGLMSRAGLMGSSVTAIEVLALAAHPAALWACNGQPVGRLVTSDTWLQVTASCLLVVDDQVRMLLCCCGLR